MALPKPVFIISQPKAGIFLLANILLELGFTGGPDGIMHIKNDKYELYPYPGMHLFATARTNPSLIHNHLHWQHSLKLVQHPNHFAVGYVSANSDPEHLKEFNVVLLTRSLEKIKQSMQRWNSSNHSEVLHLAENVAKWKNKEFQNNMFQLTFDNMNLKRIDELQKFLGLDLIKDSKTILQNALVRVA